MLWLSVHEGNYFCMNRRKKKPYWTLMPLFLGDFVMKKAIGLASYSYNIIKKIFPMKLWIIRYTFYWSINGLYASYWMHARFSLATIKGSSGIFRDGCCCDKLVPLQYAALLDILALIKTCTAISDIVRSRNIYLRSTCSRHVRVDLCSLAVLSG